jgi:hypothetical protein
VRSAGGGPHTSCVHDGTECDLSEINLQQNE